MEVLYRIQFKNISNDDLGLIAVNLGRRQKAEEQIDAYEIPYRNDELIIHSKTYKPYIREVVFATTDRAKIPLINQWLDGRGNLRTSLDPDGYYIASIITGLPYEAMMNNVDQFQVGFKVNPFFYLDSGDDPLTITSATTIFNPGTIYSEPYIKITGSGNIDLLINSTVYSFTAIDTYIQIDSSLKSVYRDTINQGDKMVGEFPVLEAGDNIIAWTGTVTSIEIIPKWREL